MPALPIFAAGSFRQWMAGNHTQSTQPTCRREDGLRGSDESATLHDYDHILQHIVESSRCPDDHHVGTDGRRMTSHGSTTAASVADGPPKAAELDALEAEIETIKADIQILRVGAESMQQTEMPNTSDRQFDLPFRVEGSKIPAPVIRQPAANAGGSKRGEVKAVFSKAQLVAASSKNILTPHLTPSPHSAQPSPHFAQPTQAATRRVHQTFRKDASPVKSIPELSPGRSTKVKAPDFAADKRVAQRHQKRTSLPQGWVMSTPPKPESDALKHHPVDQDHPAESKHSATPPSKTGSGTPLTHVQPAEQAPKVTTPQKKPSTAKSSSAEQSPRKKTSSYMSPTASAQRRNWATMSHSIPPGMSRSTARDIEVIHPGLLVAAWDESPESMAERARVSLENSNASSRKVSCSPLKSGYIARQSTLEDVVERSSSAMRLPMPLPQVANTVVTRQEPDHNLLDHIKEKLGKEDLLGCCPPPESDIHARPGDILEPVLAHMNRQMHGRSANETIDRVVIVADTESTAGSGYHDYSPSDGLHHARESRAAGDSRNEPISGLVTGLRGQSSANIGKALESKQPAFPPTSDPAILYQGPRPSGIVEASPLTDPAILFQSRRVSTNSGPHQGSVVVFNNQELPEHGSLRATAMTFVPRTEAIELNTSWPRGASLYHDGHPESNEVGGIGYLQDYKDYEPAYLRYNSDYISGETPWISPVSNSSPADFSATMESQSSSFHQGAPVNLPWSNAAFMEAPPMLDPIYQEFQANFTGQYPNAVELEAPSMQPVYGPYPGVTASAETPTFTSMSSASTMAWSSPGSMHSATPWQIHGEGRRRYQWSGGDGREISFRGVGPDAEHDPNRPVQYRDLRTNTTVVHPNAASNPQDRGSSSVSPPTAPRSMREQAKRMSDSHVPRPDDKQESK